MTDHKDWEREMSSDFNLMMDDIRSEPIPQESLQRSLDAAEAIVMTKAALKRGRMNALIVAAMMYTFVGVTSLVISKVFDVSLILTVLGMFFGIFELAFFAPLVSNLIGRNRAGEVLLDCGPCPSRKLFRLQAAVMIPAGLVMAVLSSETYSLLMAVFFVTFGLFWFNLSRGRLQICENGVMVYWSLLRWSKIKSYRWEGTTDATLMLQTTTRFAMLGRGAVPVAIEQKDVVDALMQQHVG